MKKAQEAAQAAADEAREEQGGSVKDGSTGDPIPKRDTEPKGYGRESADDD